MVISQIEFLKRCIRIFEGDNFKCNVLFKVGNFIIDGYYSLQPRVKESKYDPSHRAGRPMLPSIHQFSRVMHQPK